MSDSAATPPPLPGSAPPGNHTKNMLRNILVSVTSTVLGASVIYFLGFQHRGDDSFLVTKEATKQGWSSYVSYENTYTKNLMTFEKGLIEKDGLDKYIAGLKVESAKFTTAVAELKDKKHIDKDLIVALNRRLENEKSTLPSVEENKKNLESIMSSTKSADEMREAVVTEETRYYNNYKGTYERAINDIEDIAKTLAARYGEQFSMNEFLIVQIFDRRMKAFDSILTVFRNIPNTTDSTKVTPEKNKPDTAYATNVNPKSVIGAWNSNGDVISFTQNKKMSWVLKTGEKATGTWKIADDKLVINAIILKTNQKLLWIFNLTKITTDSFTLVAETKPNFTIYNLVRIRN